MSDLLDKTIANLPPAQRTAVLDAVVNATKDALVHVEYSWNRARDEARGVTGFLIGVANATSGTADVLVIRPTGGNRIMAISSAQVLLIKKASRPWLNGKNDEWRERIMIGDVIAGPGRKAS